VKGGELLTYKRWKKKLLILPPFPDASPGRRQEKVCSGKALSKHEESQKITKLFKPHLSTHKPKRKRDKKRNSRVNGTGQRLHLTLLKKMPQKSNGEVWV
jgi:hypothetical protein